MKGLEKISHENINQKRERAARQITNKMHFKQQAIIRDGEHYYIMIKGSIHQRYNNYK